MPKSLEVSEAEEIYELVVGHRVNEVMKKYGTTGTLGPRGFTSLNQIEAEVFRILGKSWKRRTNKDGAEEDYYPTMEELRKKEVTYMDNLLDTPYDERKKSARKKSYDL